MASSSRHAAGATTTHGRLMLMEGGAKTKGSANQRPEGHRSDQGLRLITPQVMRKQRLSLGQCKMLSARKARGTSRLYPVGRARTLRVLRPNVTGVREGEGNGMLAPPPHSWTPARFGV